MIEKKKLNDGSSIPMLGMGAYLMADGPACEQNLANGLAMGYRLIDTAAAYQNEASVGRAVKNSGVPREEIFVTTKIWVQDYGYENTARAVDRCLTRLGLDYADMILLHRAVGDTAGSYRALEDAQKAGKIRSIGVCNHTAAQLTALLGRVSVVPAVNQVECHPLQQEKALRQVMQQHDIALESWFPLGHGSKRILLNAGLAEMAAKYGVSVPQLVLRWHIQEGFVAIPKSGDPAHMQQNMAVFGFVLSEADMDAIRAVDQNRYLGGDPENPENIARWLSTRFDAI